MMRNAGGLLAGSMLSSGFVPPSLCSIEGESAGGGAGGGAGAADLLEDPPAAGGAAAPAPPPATPGAPPATLPPPAAPPAWAADLSADAVGEGQASNRDYATAKGFADPNALVTSYRELEKQLHGGKGYVKLPGEGAKPEEVAAFRTAMGVPEKAADYAVDLPAAGEGDLKLELDTAFIEPLREAAHQANVSGPAFKALGAAFVKLQLDQMHADVKASDTEASTRIAKEGANGDAFKANFRTGAKLLGLSRADIVAIQNARRPDGTRFGADTLLDKLASLGAIAGEDVLKGGERQNFGVASEDEAERKLNEMIADPETAKKLRAKDPATVATYNRLNDALAHYRQLKK